MPDIRRPTPTGALNLPTLGDFVYWYRFDDDSDFPAGLELYILIGDPGPTQTRWNFEITGHIAHLKIESEIVATIKPRTKYWLMLKDTTTTPTTEQELQTGQVKKVNAQ